MTNSEISLIGRKFGKKTVIIANKFYKHMINIIIIELKGNLREYFKSIYLSEHYDWSLANVIEFVFAKYSCHDVESMWMGKGLSLVSE